MTEETRMPWDCKHFGNCIYSICPCDKWELGEKEELLPLEIEDISKLINCKPGDCEEIKEK